MVALSPTFLTLAVFCSSALAAPWPTASRQHTHRIRSLPNGLRVKSYHPASTFKTFSDGVDPPKGSGNSLTSSFKDSALAYIGQELGSEQVEFASSYEADTAKHVYVHQKINGFKVANAVAHSSLNKKGKIVAFSSSFVTPQAKPATVAKISKEAAHATVKSKAGATPTNRTTDLEYFTKDDGTLALSHVVQAHVDGNGHLVEVFVDATTGDVAGLIDFTTTLTYHVLPVTKQSPEQGLETLTDPEDEDASPKGWTENGTTSGNNAVVYKGSESDVFQASADGFTTEWKGIDADPAEQSGVDVARTNAFYVVNRLHDVFYKYGFTEAAFNFQVDNNGKGGEGNDPVMVSVQDAADFNNADMTTPGDGQPGAMRMFLWDLTNPHRDGALENDIVVHEFFHGVSNRLTGGGTGRCLGTDEAGGMGEGWSDVAAFWMEQTDATVKDYTMGSFVTNQASGIRSHPYSTSKEVNPYIYATLAEKHVVHDMGEIWANTLINVYAALVEASGFDAEAANNADSTKGNAIFMHLLIDSLAIQPCNPTFVSARAAWIQADKDRYNGANTCTIWKAFASRGLGSGANDQRVDNSDVPQECSGAQEPSTPPTEPVPEPTETEPVPEPTETEPTPEPTETEPAPEPSQTEPVPEPEPSQTESTPEPEPTETESTLEPEPTESEDPEAPFPTEDPESPVPTGEPDLPFPGEEPLPGGGGQEGTPEELECPVLGWHSKPSWWPFSWC